MTIAFDAASSGQIQGASSLTVSHTVGGGSNRALWVIAVCWNSSDFLGGATVTYGGVSMGSDIVVQGGFVGLIAYVWQLAAPTSGTADVIVTPTSGAYLDVWAISASGVDQTALADVANKVGYATPNSTSPQSQSVTTPAGGACLSFGAYRNTGASTLSVASGNGFTAVGTPPAGYAHTALATAQGPTAHGWSWTNGSPGNDPFSMFALPINAGSGGGGGSMKAGINYFIQRGNRNV